MMKLSTASGGPREASAQEGAGLSAIVGGGISGLSAAYELAHGGARFTLFEASGRLGGAVETVRTQGFVIECGPDSWVTEKPWARDLAAELGLGDQIVFSNDQSRATYLAQDRRLIPLPDGMRMMVPTSREALEQSPLFSAAARQGYLREPERAAELKASTPEHDESVASFVRRHFGPEAAQTIAAPLLSGVFGGDIDSLSVRAVMPTFVRMEAEHGSLIAALQERDRGQRDHRRSEPPQAIFSTLSTGMETLIERMGAFLPEGSVHLRQPVTRIQREADGWRVGTSKGEHRFQFLLLATPPHVTRALLQSLGASSVGSRMANLLPQRSSSAIVVALGFPAPQASGLSIPRGFGFLVPPTSPSSGEHKLLACTFADQKFPGRAPAGAVLLRAFFGGDAGSALDGSSDDVVLQLARQQLASLLGPLPSPAVSLVRHLPQSLPQYEVGHLERIAELESLARTFPGLRLIGSAYHGVGVSDLVREGRVAARETLKDASKQ